MRLTQTIRHLVYGLLASALAALAAAPVAAAGPALSTEPPRILLATKAGRQAAVQESYCVTSRPSASGVRITACAELPQLAPRRLTIVRAGELVRILLPGARMVPCGRRCANTVTVRRFGCARAVRRFRLGGRTTAWRVRLGPGAYELQLHVRRFVMRDGRRGETSGSLGLLVAKSSDRAIIPATDDFKAC